MCGIAGFIGIEPHWAQPSAPKVLHALKHRGPDDSGAVSVPFLHHPPAELVHTRLAILDLTAAGHQPMQDHPVDSRISPNWVTFNGEIFNYLQLQKELAAAGWPCRTRCDTEVILHAYRVWGEQAVERFHGMFAFALLDTTRGIVWLCRDRLGLKPLYLFRPQKGGLIFSSEVRAILAAGPELVPPKIRQSALEAFLAQGAVYGDQSIVEGIELLKPGHSLITDFAGRTKSEIRYWRVPVPAECPYKTRHEAVDAVGYELRRAVQQRLIADVPLGLFLSGGVDSGALATIITEDPNIHLRTVSIGFDSDGHDETEMAHEVARELNTDHRVLKLRGDEVLHDLPDAIAAFDQPTIDGFNTYFVSREARRSGLTVTLSGTGGDELFGGYPTFRFVPKTGNIQAAGRYAGPLRTLMRQILCRSGRRGGMRLAELFNRPHKAIQRYLLRWELFLPGERRWIHDLPQDSDPYSGIPKSLLAEMLNDDERDPITQVSRFEIRGFLGQVLLRDGDISSMTNQLELRTPILEHRLVETAINLPGKWKKPDPRNKPMLIDAIGPRFPKCILGKPKKGFALPWKPWFRGPLAPLAEAALRDEDLWNRIGFRPEVPMIMWKRFRSGDRCIAATQILALVVLASYIKRHNLQ